MGVDEISLSNIWQVRYVTAEGEIKPGDFRDLDGVVESALKKARWQIKPSKIPDELRSAWRSIEFGDFGAAGKDISEAMKSNDEEVKSAAKELKSAAMKALKRQANPAMKLARDGDFWPAYQEISRLCSTFESYDVPAKLVKAQKALEKKDQVKNELRADKKLQAAIELGSNKRMISLAKKRLKAIIQDFPTTDAANTAREKLGLKKKARFR